MWQSNNSRKVFLYMLINIQLDTYPDRDKTLVLYPMRSQRDEIYVVI